MIPEWRVAHHGTMSHNAVDGSMRTNVHVYPSCVGVVEETEVPIYRRNSCRFTEGGWLVSGDVRPRLKSDAELHMGLVVTCGWCRVNLVHDWLAFRHWVSDQGTRLRDDSGVV